LKIESIKLINFRKFEKLYLEFEDGLNNIYGGNGTGKSSVLEAIAYLSIPRSFRGSPDKYLVRWGSDFFTIQGRVLDTTAHDISITFQLPSSKRITVDGKRIRKYSQLMETFTCMAFSTKDYAIIDASPEDRRRLFDRMISLMDQKYFVYLIRYRKVLRQKNMALKKGLPVKMWNRQLEELARYIVKVRKEVVQLLSQRLDSRFRIEYLDTLKGRNYDELLEEEKARGFTIAGPHRDDFIFLIDGRPMKYYASEGERRIFYLQLIVAFREIIAERTGREPVVVLDEPGNVLDERTFKKFIESLRGQVIIASLHPVEGAHNIPLEEIQNPL